ncbi:MAG: hypothetical protein M0Z89_07280 [Nitrospiraceae bacterium]|nr:hypothetical protein [Nitrospiraceae bacterium]
MFLTILLIIHVICVIVWIGGVTFVTTVIFPMMYRTEGSLEKALLFQGVEHRFSAMVKWLIAIVGITGFWMLYAKYGFAVLAQAHGIGVVIMIFAWALYTTVLLSERKIFARIFADPQKIDMDQALKLINIMHWFLLVVSYSAVAGGVWFGHSG